MNKNKWPKRVYKLKGSFNLFYSLILLRYTSCNDLYLKKYFRSNPIDKLHVGCGLLHLKGWCNVLFEPNQEYGRPKKVKGADVLNFDDAGVDSWVSGAGPIDHQKVLQRLS